MTDQSFRYASPHLWNQLPASLRQPRADLSIMDSDLPMDTSSAFFHKFTTPIIHNSFTLSLPAQNLPLSQILPTIGPHSFSRTDTTDFHCSPCFAYPCGRLSWLLPAFDHTLISHFHFTNLPARRTRFHWTASHALRRCGLDPVFAACQSLARAEATRGVVNYIVILSLRACHMSPHFNHE